VAIKGLFYVATEPRVTAEQAFDRAGKDVVVDLVRDLNDKSLLILESARRTRSGFVKEIYQCYLRLSEAHGEIPFSYMHFYNNLSYLQSCGLILLVSTKVARAYTNRIRLLFDPAIEAETYHQRFA
jgi:Cdc6-like AAA superfamily ATPase